MSVCGGGHIGPSGSELCTSEPLRREARPTMRGRRAADLDSTRPSPRISLRRCRLPRVSSAAECAPSSPFPASNPACRDRAARRRRDRAGFTRSSTTAFGSWHSADGHRKIYTTRFAALARIVSRISGGNSALGQEKSRGVFRPLSSHLCSASRWPAALRARRDHKGLPDHPVQRVQALA